jgi:hypothetical protein
VADGRASCKRNEGLYAAAAPEKVEGDDYRIPSSARFREWRRFLGPICHYLSLSVIKLAETINALRDATTELGISFFQTAFRCELKGAVTGKVTIVNVPLTPTRVLGPQPPPQHGRLLEGQ